jgi:hypothetical protein
MSKATNDLKAFTDKLSKTMRTAVDNKVLNKLGEFTVNIVQRRTRLGYGVDDNFEERRKLARLSDKYVQSRRKYAGLSSTTTPKKSNLTRTGQMLESLRHKVKGNTVEIRPTGRRSDGKTNEDVAYYNAIGGRNKPPRIFNNVSRLEFQQILRFYRREFTNLIKKLR